MSLQEVADLLSDARSLRTAFVQRAPDPASVAKHDLDEAARALGTAAPIERLIHCVDLWSVIASEQLYGLSLMIRDGTSVFPIFPILRSIIEHAACIAWVLDNDSSSRQRAARAALAVLRSQEEVMKSAGRMGDKKSPEYQRVRAHWKKLRIDINIEFGTLMLDPLSLEGEETPRPTDIIEFAGNRWAIGARQWVSMYDYLCGTANHPSLNADEYFDLSDPANPIAFIPNDLLYRFLRAGLLPYVDALRCIGGYMGWPATGFDDYCRQIERVLAPADGDNLGQAPADQQSAQ